MARGIFFLPFIRVISSILGIGEILHNGDQFANARLNVVQAAIRHVNHFVKQTVATY
jgi:hypothetical protein